MELGKNKEEVALTKKLAATLVQREVMEPMGVNGWSNGAPPSPAQAAIVIAERARAAGEPEDQIAAFLEERGVKYTPPAGSGQPAAKAEGAPAVAPAAQTPASSGQPAKVETPAATPAKTDVPADLEAAKNVLTLMESLRDANGKIMGKYDSLAEGLKGAGHLANMAKTALARAEAAEAKLASAGSPVVAASPAATPAAAPAIKPFVPASRPGLLAAQARLDAVLAKVKESETGFDGDSAKEFAEATRGLAQEQALAVAEEQRERDAYARTTSQARWDAVNQFMTERYPESANLDEVEFGLFLRLNPLLTEAMAALREQGREARAAELGYTEFVKSRGTVPGSPTLSHAEAQRKEIDLEAREQVRKEARDEALKDAGIVHGSAGGASAVETPGITGPTQDDINSMIAGMRREGEGPGSRSGAEWRRAVIGRFLPPDLFGPNAG